MTQGALVIPAPPQAVETWPLIGEPLYRFWDLASTNLQAALGRIGPELNAIGSWMLAFVGQIGIGLLHFVVAIFIAAALLTNAAGGERVAHEQHQEFAAFQCVRHERQLRNVDLQ